MGGRALGALGPAHEARECRQYSRPTHSLYRDPQGPGGQGAGQGLRGRPGGQAGMNRVECREFFAQGQLPYTCQF